MSFNMINLFVPYITIFILTLQGGLLAQNNLSQKLYDNYSKF